MTARQKATPRKPRAQATPVEEERLELEPTVLDWFHSLLRLKPIPIPAADTAKPAGGLRRRVVETIDSRVSSAGLLPEFRVAHLRFPVALVFAFIAQATLVKRPEQVWTAVLLYLFSVAVIGWAFWEGDFELASIVAEAKPLGAARVHVGPLVAGIGLALMTYWTSAGNTFRSATVLFWSSSILLTTLGFWEGDFNLLPWWRRFRNWLQEPRISISIRPWQLVLLLALGLSVYFRLGGLEQVPPEPWSDHAEKILDIVDVLNGKASIFFGRNSGREAAQFYLAAAAVRWLGAPLSFITLKAVTALAGLLTLPFIYLLGRELWGRPTALAGTLLAATAFWPNVFSRIGMRIAFHPLFLAAAMFFLVRGLRRGRPNDLLLSGIAVGAGLYGYSAARVTPLVILVGFLLYLAHPSARGQRRTALLRFAMLVTLAVVVAVPMLRVAHDVPNDLFFRTVTRITSAEQPLPGPPLPIFFSNLWNALRMFSWDAGSTWIFSIPFQPILDWISAALFHLGVALVIVRYLRTRRWEDLYLLLAIPLLLLPSVLALAFPIENPHPSRAAGAIVPVFLLTGLTLAALAGYFDRLWGWRRLGVGLSVALFLVIAKINYQLTIVEYGERMLEGSWNVTEAGGVVRGFIDSVGRFENAYVVAYPHWMDSRLVADIAGWSGADMVIWPEQLAQVPVTDEAQLFLLHPDDEANLITLRGVFPSGILSRYTSSVEGRDFLIYFVPPTAEAGT